MDNKQRFVLSLSMALFMLKHKHKYSLHNHIPSHCHNHGSNSSGNDDSSLSSSMQLLGKIKINDIHTECIDPNNIRIHKHTDAASKSYSNSTTHVVDIHTQTDTHLRKDQITNQVNKDECFHNIDEFDCPQAKEEDANTVIDHEARIKRAREWFDTRCLATITLKLDFILIDSNEMYPLLLIDLSRQLSHILDQRDDHQEEINAFYCHLKKRIVHRCYAPDSSISLFKWLLDVIARLCGLIAAESATYHVIRSGQMYLIKAMNEAVVDLVTTPDILKPNDDRLNSLCAVLRMAILKFVSENSSQFIPFQLNAAASESTEKFTVLTWTIQQLGDELT